MHRRFFIGMAVFTLYGLFLAWGIGPNRVWAGGDELDPALLKEGQLASLADEADLSRSTDGELFEDDSHSLHDDLSGFESDHGLESEHEGLEGDHGGEGEHGGGEDGGGDSGGEGGDN